jgi:hypothetical protein
MKTLFLTVCITASFSLMIGTAHADQDMVCEGVLSSERTEGKWWIRIGECDLMPDALEKDRIAILKGCNPKQKFFALCRVFARTRESDDAVYGLEIIHVYLARSITGKEWEEKTELAKDERAAIKRGFHKEPEQPKKSK